MIARNLPVKGADIIVLGLTFKENCPDLRNSKVVDVIRELQSYGCQVHIHDPLADSAEAEQEYGIHLTAWDDLPQASALVAAVGHQQYADMGTAVLAEKLQTGGLFVDVKSTHDPAIIEQRLSLWRL